MIRWRGYYWWRMYLRIELGDEGELVKIGEAAVVEEYRSVVVVGEEICF